MNRNTAYYNLSGDAGKFDCYSPLGSEDTWGFADCQFPLINETNELGLKCNGCKVRVILIFFIGNRFCGEGLQSCGYVRTDSANTPPHHLNRISFKDEIDDEVFTTTKKSINFCSERRCYLQLRSGIRFGGTLLLCSVSSLHHQKVRIL